MFDAYVEAGGNSIDTANLYPFLKLRCCREEDPFCGCGTKAK